MQIQILNGKQCRFRSDSWLLQKPTDLDLHCLQRQDISGFSRTRVNSVVKRLLCNDSKLIENMLNLDLNDNTLCVVSYREILDILGWGWVFHTFEKKKKNQRLCCVYYL